MYNIKFRDLLAGFIVVLCFSYFFYISLPHYNAKDNANVGDIKTALVGTLTLVLGWYFGSSKASQDKDDSIKSLINNNTNAKEQSNSDTGDSGIVS